MSSKLAPEAVQPDAIRRYERESEDAAKRLQDALTELRTFEAEMEGLSKRLPQIEMASQKVDLDLKTGLKRIKEAEKRVQDLK